MIGVLTWLALAASGALAQDAIDPASPGMSAQLWRPPVDAATSLWADDTSWAPGGYLMARVAGGWMADPIVFRYDDGEVVHVLRDSVGANLVLGASFGRARLGLDLPVQLWSRSDLFDAPAGLGDVALDLKVNALDRGQWPVGLAVSARVTAPTGFSNLPAPLVDPRANAEFAVIADRREGRGFYAANLGLRGSVQPGEFFDAPSFQPFLRASAARLMSETSGVSADVAIYAGRERPYATKGSVQGLVGGWYRVADAWVLRGGVGRGLGGGVGSPRARAVAMFGYEPPRERDSDFDGILDRLDECPFDAEDFDRFEDWDGCPEADNDSDGVPDRKDFCTLEPEDIDGFEDQDGCPEAATEVHLRVQDAKGQLIDGARVALTGPGLTPRFGGSELRVILEPGAYAMTGRADGYRTVEQTVEVVEGRFIEVIRTLEVENPRGKVEIELLGGHGRPVPAAQWASAGEAFAPLSDTEALVLDAGPWQLALRAPGWGSTTLDLRAHPDRTFEASVRLPAARVSLEGAGVKLTEPVVFSEDPLSLEPGVQPVLDDLAGLMLDRPDGVLVIAARPAPGTDASRAEIVGEQRALAVKRYLTARGVPGTRLRIAALLDSAPGEDVVFTFEPAKPAAKPPESRE